MRRLQQANLEARPAGVRRIRTAVIRRPPLGAHSSTRSIGLHPACGAHAGGFAARTGSWCAVLIGDTIRTMVTVSLMPIGLLVNDQPISLPGTPVAALTKAIGIKPRVTRTQHNDIFAYDAAGVFAY